MATDKNNGGWMVLAVWAALCWVAVLNPLIAEYSKSAEYYAMPTWPRLIQAILSGLAAIGTTTIAFFSTSYARFKDAKADDDADIADNAKINAVQPKAPDAK